MLADSGTKIALIIIFLTTFEDPKYGKVADSLKLFIQHSESEHEPTERRRNKIPQKVILIIVVLCDTPSPLSAPTL